MKEKLSVRTLLYLLRWVIQCMTYYSRIVYLAGPDVFEADPIAVGEKKKTICKCHGYTGLYPLDNEVPQQKSKEELARLIFEGNVNYIQMSNMVIANLNNFRGACDSGTMWEIGYALSIGKIVVAYAEDLMAIPELVRKHIICIKASSFEECINQVDNMDFCDYKNIFICFRGDMIYNLDAKKYDIRDADAVTSFKVGYLYGRDVKPKVTISDKRSQVEKYGTECCGYSVEDFGLPYNLMIWFSSTLVDAV
ncbi:MAG: nucleoside 2-deoxyribosyltransferase [Clostridia bacterium]|nr:nucleoside 2-deoxyribosyltransferase [Clostridia bacterium]